MIGSSLCVGVSLGVGFLLVWFYRTEENVAQRRLTLFSHNKLWANQIRPQFFVDEQG